jgi:phosphatidylserine decarboxylase
VISIGKKVFRTCIIWHSLTPVWDKKLLFHVREYGSMFKVRLTVLDWDYLLSNNHVGDAIFMVSEFLADMSQMDPVTGLYDNDADGKHPMKEFQLPLLAPKEMPWR